MKRTASLDQQSFWEDNEPTITRKSLLNRSALGFWCINAVQGCSHGCRYPCHAVLLARRRGQVDGLSVWCKPRIVSNAAELLERELRRRREITRVHMSLTTDPFMVGHPEVTALTLRLIERINAAGIPCSILTKGPLPAELSNEHRFRRDNTYGISLVSIDEGFRERWEPGAASYEERIGAARVLHQRGCRTRAHVEPYPTPNLFDQDLRDVLGRVSFVDSLFFGPWNYHAAALSYPGRARFYGEQRAIARRFCEMEGIAYEGTG